MCHTNALLCSDCKIFLLPRVMGDSILKVQVYATHTGGFWVQNSLNKGPELGKMVSKMAILLPKFIIKWV